VVANRNSEQQCNEGAVFKNAGPDDRCLRTAPVNLLVATNVLNTKAVCYRFFHFFGLRMKKQIGHSTGHVSRQRNLGQKTTPQAGPQNMSLCFFFGAKGSLNNGETCCN